MEWVLHRELANFDVTELCPSDCAMEPVHFLSRANQTPPMTLKSKAVDLGFQSLLVEEKIMRPNVKGNWRQIEFEVRKRRWGRKNKKGYVSWSGCAWCSVFFFRMPNYISKLILSLVQVTVICFFAIYNQGVHWRTQIWCVIKHYVLSKRKRSLSFILLSSWWKHLRVLHKYSLNTKLRAHGFREMP